MARGPQLERSLCLEHKVVIKIARPEDLPDLFEMVDLYDGNVQINRNKTKNALREMLYNAGVFFAVLDGKTIGGIGAYCLPCLYNDDIMFCVMFLFIKKGFRKHTKEIIKELELVLMPTKVSKILFGFLSGQNQDKQIRFMQMLGYKRFETHVFKNI